MVKLKEGLMVNDIWDGDFDVVVYKVFEYKYFGSLVYIGNFVVFDFGDGWNVVGGFWVVYVWWLVYFV